MIENIIRNRNEGNLIPLTSCITPEEVMQYDSLKCKEIESKIKQFFQKKNPIQKAFELFKSEFYD